LIKSLQQAFAWFIGGLVDTWTAVADGLRRRRRLRLVREGERYHIEHADGHRDAVPLDVEHRDGELQLGPPNAAAALKDHDVDLVLPVEELLVRMLDPLPAESRPYLDGIVRHQLERLAPWRSDDVLHAYQATPIGHGDDRLQVTIAATARSIHAGLLSALRALGPRELQLLYRDPQFAGGEIALPVNAGPLVLTRQGRLQRNVVMVLSVLLFLSLAGSAVLAYSWRQADATLTAAEDAVADQRRSLAALGGRKPASGRELDTILARRRDTPFSVLALEALSNALPDDTWITELRIAEGKLRVIGVSQSVSGLVPLIESSPGFAEATFFAPTSRLPDGRGDRFHIETKLVKPKEVKK
jgi:general secretion pathway protein L